jgi:hypothetical protein
VASARAAVPIEARRRAALRLAEEGPGLLTGWRDDPEVVEVRWVAGGSPEALRHALDSLLASVMAQRDPAAGLAAVHVLQALVLAVLDESSP